MLRLKQRHFLFIATLVVTGWGGPATANHGAQLSEIPRHLESYSWSSGHFDGAYGRQPLVFKDIVSIPGVPWMQLRFKGAYLGNGSYIELISLADGAMQFLDADSLKQWRNQSAYFNGDAVEVRLFVGAEDKGVVIGINEIVVGEWGGPATRSICGSDNRVASNEQRVARIDPIGCTGWTIDSGQLLTAGHCLAGGSSNQTLSFNVPASLSDGTVQFPGPEDQYSINTNSFDFTNGGVGNDWGVFEVFNNSQTGLQPIAAQGSFTVVQDLGPANIRITGFGVDSGTTNQTNQTNVGPNSGSSGTTMRYRADSMGGNSGGPVIDEATGLAVGIHTHGGCTASGGNNSGTSFFHSALWNALDTAPPPPPPPPPTCSNELYFGDFEAGDADGWTQGNNSCSTGSFIVGNPDGVTNSGVQTQVSGSASGTGSLFTQLNTGGAGNIDVDGGTCEAFSPVISASGEVSISLDYFHGQRDAGDDSTDGFVIDVLNNGAVIGSMVSIGDVTSNAAWTADSATLTNAGNVQLRIRVTDGSSAGDLIEAGVDNVQICGDEGTPPPPPPPPGTCAVDDDFESGAAGWSNSASSTCSTGSYTLGDPTEQTNQGVTTQVGGSNSGVNSIFTATNSSAGNADVDGGNCILASPSWSVSDASTLSVAWWHGQRDSGDDASGDFFRLEYTTNGGSSWNALATNGDSRSNAAWATATAQIPAGTDVELRVQCSDGSGPGDLIECGIDDVSICSN